METLLNAIKSYIPLDKRDEEIIDSLFNKKIVAKGAHLLQAGNVCRHVTFIETGLVRYYIINDGEEQTNYFNKGGEFVCDYMSFLPQIPSIVNIQALENTTIYNISFNNLQLFYKQVTHGERFGRLAIEQVFINIISQVKTLYTDTPEMRYNNFLSAYAGIAQRIPQYLIAQYVGVKPPSLSRIRKRIASQH